MRSLSLELSINPNTIQKAYAELDGRGIIYTLPGRGGFVSQNAPELLAEARRSRLGTVRELARNWRWPACLRMRCWPACAAPMSSPACKR